MNRRYRLIRPCAAAITLAVGLATMGVRAELPGMPAPVAPASIDANSPSLSTGTNAREARTGRLPAATAQPGPVRGSLFKAGAAAGVAPGLNADPAIAPTAPPVSFFAVPPAQPRRYAKHDIVTIVIREQSNSTTDGKGDSKKTQSFDFGIEQFLQLALSASGIPTVGNVGDPDSLPEIKFKYSNDRKTDATQERKDSLSARLSATVIDVKPNGTLVIEAVKHILVDKEEQIFTLSGVCRVEDIAIDNTVLSTQIANLTLSKQTRGEVRDGTRRGWLNKFIDTVSPF